MPRTKKSLSSVVTYRVREVFLTALPIFLILIGAVYVYAAGISWPQEPYAPSGLQAVFVGITRTALNGNQKGAATDGYVATKNLCNAAFAGSHVCTPDEMINSYNRAIPAVLAQPDATGGAWIANGPPGYITNVTNDCNGWQSTASTVFGSIWRFRTDDSSVTQCDAALSFACCK